MQIRAGTACIFVDKQEESFETLEESLEALLYELICKIWREQPEKEFDDFIRDAQKDPEEYQKLQEAKWRKLYAKL